MNILIYIHNWFNNIFYTLTLSYHTNIYYNMSFSPTKIFLFYKATNIMLKEKREKKNRYNDVIRASITSAPVVRPNREQKARALTHEQTQYSMVVRGGHIFEQQRIKETRRLRSFSYIKIKRCIVCLSNCDFLGRLDAS